MQPSLTARYVWYDAQGLGRNLYACFRRSFALAAPVRAATLCLFADTNYQLFINGALVEFGPTRFDPRFPMYDVIDIARYLRAGRNVIAVSANSYQHKTYHAISHPAGFIAWGEVTDAEGAVLSLETPGEWRCVPDLAHARYAGKFSFALNAADLFEQAGEAAGWKEADYDDAHWPLAEPVAGQDAWGPLEARTIPFMAKTAVPIARVKHLLPLAKTEDWFSFAIPFPQGSEDDSKKYSNFFAFSTWVYSPVAQEITVGTFWGDNWLNGTPVPRGVESVLHNQRINQRWALQQGWNHLFGKVGAYQDIVEQYFAFPLEAGITLSADRGATSDLRFKHTRLLTSAEYAERLAEKTLPYAADDALEEIGGWVHVDAAQPAQSPCREQGWDSFAEPIEVVTPESLQGHTFRLADYPHGFSLLLDAGQTRLVLPHLIAHGVAGATIDLGYHEHLRQDGMHLLLQHHHPCSDRVLCDRDTLDWMPSHPRGFRYMMITVRHPARDITFDRVAWLSAMYPVKEIGSFTCSDAELTEIWAMGSRTQATNMEDAYVDCVGRERGMYGRDTIIQYHVNLAAFGDQALMGRCMQLYGQSPDASGKFRAVYPNTGDYTIADFALNMVEGYWNYYAHSGDLARVEQDWPAILRDLQWFHDLADERADLLLDADWPTHRGVAAMYGGFHGDLSAHGYQAITGVHCGFSCTYLMAIRAAMRLATALGATEEYAALAGRADVLSASIRAAFWDEARGCYADNAAHDTYSAHASVLAFSAGVVSEAQLPALRRHVTSELRSIFRNGYDPSNDALVSPNYAFYIFDGLYALGLADTAEGMMRQGWGWMLAQGMRTCGEYFSLHASHCHAWSASPTYYLSKHVLGVQFPQAPDLDKVEIRVQTGNVTSAEGVVPHPKGRIEVRWHMEGVRRVFDYIRAPEGVSILVVDGD